MQLTGTWWTTRVDNDMIMNFRRSAAREEEETKGNVARPVTRGESRGIFFCRGAVNGAKVVADLETGRSRMIHARMTLIYFSAHDRALDHEPVASRRSLLCRRRLHALLNRSTNRLLENDSALDCATTKPRAVA